MLRVGAVSTLIMLIVTCSYCVAISGETYDGKCKGSKDFERLKQIVGVWEGTSSMGEGGGDKNVTIEYRLTSGGSPILETLFAGTPHDMASVYYEMD